MNKLNVIFRVALVVVYAVYGSRVLPPVWRPPYEHTGNSATTALYFVEGVYKLYVQFPTVSPADCAFVERVIPRHTHRSDHTGGVAVYNAALLTQLFYVVRADAIVSAQMTYGTFALRAYAKPPTIFFVNTIWEF